MSGESDELRVEIERLRREVERLRAGAPGEPADHDAWLRTILAHSPDVISILSPEGRLLFLSRTPSGVSPEHALGIDTSDFVPPRDRARWQAALHKALETGEPQRVDVESTGGMHWETRLAPIRAPDGGRALLGIATNVTARRDAERALRDSAEKLRLALAASQVGLWHWDVVTDDVLWDEATTRAFGSASRPARATSSSRWCTPTTAPAWVPRSAGRSRRAFTRISSCARSAPTASFARSSSGATSRATARAARRLCAARCSTSPPRSSSRSSSARR